MISQQKLKADALKSAQSAPKPDPKIGEAAKAEAAAIATGKSRVQRISKASRHLDEPVSEFDDPAGNTVQNK